MYTSCMGLFSAKDRHLLSSVAGLAYSNPFLPERIAYERAALGRQFVDGGPVWSASVSDPDATPPNVISIYSSLQPRIEELHTRVAAAPDLSEEDLRIYEESVHYLLYQRYHANFVSGGSARGK